MPASVSTQTRPPRRDAADNRAAILAAAAAALRVDPDASFEAIAAEAGLSRRTLYGHFPSRDDLVTEVLAIGAARIAASMTGIASIPACQDDPAVEIAVVGASIWTEVGHVRVVAQLALRDPFRDTVAAALEPARALLRDAIARGSASGRLRDDIPVPVLARLVERAAIAVLTEAADPREGSELTDAEARRLVMLNGLAVVGFAWREAGGIADRAALVERPAATTPTVQGASA